MKNLSLCVKFFALMLWIGSIGLTFGADDGLDNDPFPRLHHRVFKQTDDQPIQENTIIPKMLRKIKQDTDANTIEPFSKETMAQTLEIFQHENPPRQGENLNDFKKIFWYQCDMRKVSGSSFTHEDVNFCTAFLDEINGLTKNKFFTSSKRLGVGSSLLAAGALVGWWGYDLLTMNMVTMFAGASFEIPLFLLGGVIACDGAYNGLFSATGYLMERMMRYSFYQVLLEVGQEQEESTKL